MFEQHVPGMLLCAFACSISLHLFTMQNGERVVRVVGNVGSSMSSRVELVVLRGQVYFQSEESLSKFMSNTAVMSYLPVPRIVLGANSCVCMHALFVTHRRTNEAASKLVNVRTIVCS